jgi:diguanylate cyclase (GGDEF)-like protein/PAS domain S-box-containing protein
MPHAPLERLARLTSAALTADACVVLGPGGTPLLGTAGTVPEGWPARWHACVHDLAVPSGSLVRIGADADGVPDAVRRCLAEAGFVAAAGLRSGTSAAAAGAELEAWTFVRAGRPGFPPDRPDVLVDAIDTAAQELARDRELERAWDRCRELERAHTDVREILDSISDGFIVLDRDWRYRYVNKAAQQLLRRTREDLIGRVVSDVFPDFEGSVFQREYERAFSQKIPVRFTAPSRAVPGAWFDVNAAPSADGVSMYFHDVTERVQFERALRESEERYRNLFETARDAIYITRPDGQFIEANQSAIELFGYDPDEITALNARDLYADPEARAEFQRNMQEYGSIRDFEVRLRRKDGTVLDCLVSATEWRSRSGDLIGYQGVIHDITHRKQAEAALRQSEERFRLMIEGSEQVFFYIHDSEHRFEYLSPSVADVLGYSPDELVGKPYDVLLTGDPSDAVVHTCTESALRSGHRSGSYTSISRHKDGRDITVEHVEGPIVHRGEIVGVQGFARDITGRMQVERQLMHDALHDTLTGLPNRALLKDRLELVIERCRRKPEACFAVLFLDLDRFKVINDSLGHLTGDKLLIALAERLSDCLRPADTIARLGGDEFTVLLEEIGDAADACRVADRVHEALRVPFHVDGHEVFTSTSIGIAIGSNGYTSADALLRDADIAMYRAKEHGPGGYKLFDASMHAQAVELLRLETDLRRALEREELVLHYQPIVDLASGNPVAFEALLRWQHPDRGLLAPADFIRAAEETGLIVPIGWWALQECCTLAARWRSRFGAAAGRINVNMSAGQFVQPDLLDRIDRMLAAARLDGSALAFEITESVIMENAAHAHEMLFELKRRGVQLCIDDFGVGYSSLAYLQTFPVETLKIDRSFILRIGPDGENSEIVRTILTLAEDLGMQAVAEGVETESQRSHLRRLGCIYAQGYHFSYPLTAAEIDRWMDTGQPTPWDTTSPLAS